MLQNREETYNTIQLHLDNLHLMLREALTLLPSSNKTMMASSPERTDYSAPEHTQDLFVIP
jgi:hypothetical protein